MWPYAFNFTVIMLLAKWKDQHIYGGNNGEADATGT